MLSTRRFVFSLTILSLALASPAGAVTFGQTDDFQDGTTQGWSSTFADPTPPVNEANVGPAGSGDHSLFIEAAALESIAIRNSTQWTGDYLSAGIDGIQFAYDNFGTTPFSLGATISGPGGTVITLSGAPVPGGGGWSTGTIDLSSANLLPLSGSIASTLANVTLIELDHISAGTNLIASAPISVRLDNIQAVPEPSSLALACFGACGCWALCRGWIRHARREPSASG